MVVATSVTGVPPVINMTGGITSAGAAMTFTTLVVVELFPEESVDE